MWKIKGCSHGNHNVGLKNKSFKFIHEGICCQLKLNFYAAQYTSSTTTMGGTMMLSRAHNTLGVKSLS